MAISGIKPQRRHVAATRPILAPPPAGPNLPRNGSLAAVEQEREVPAVWIAPCMDFGRAATAGASDVLGHAMAIGVATDLGGTLTHRRRF
jgi:hypothetical protein